MLRLIDTHSHVDRYPAGAVGDLLERAKQTGVTTVVSVGLSLSSSTAAVALAARHAGLVAAAVGIHPLYLHEAGPPDQALTDLARLAGGHRVVAIGEVGLEYGSGAALPAAQQSFLSGCLHLGRRLDLPVILHVVGAHDDALRIISDARAGPLIVHYFTGGAGLADRYLAAGCTLSVGKPVTRPENRDLREAIARVPLDRLLLETDSYPLPGRTTEPRDLPAVCRAVADLRGEDVEVIAEATTASARRLFRLD